jgi:hypothetical protein
MVLDWIANGVNFPIKKRIPPFFHKSSTVLDDEEKAYWEGTLLPHYIATGAIIEIERPQHKDTFISNCHFEPKGSGGYRLVVDLRFINTFFEKCHLKYETL